MRQGMGSWDLLMAAALTVLTALLVATGIGGPLRFALGVLFVVIVPGYVCVAALHPALAKETSQNDEDSNFPSRLGWVDRILLSIGLSFALALISTYAVSAIIGEIRFSAAFAGLAASTLTLLVVAATRRRRLPSEERERFGTVWAPGLGHRPKWATVGVVGFVALFLAAWSLTAFEFGNVPKLTEFAVFDQDGQHFDASDVVPPGSNQSLVLLLANHERATRSYQVTVAFERTNNSLGEGQRLAVETLRDGESREVPVSFLVESSAVAAHLQLFLEGSAAPHRSLTIRYGPG